MTKCATCFPKLPEEKFIRVEVYGIELSEDKLKSKCADIWNIREAKSSDEVLGLLFDLDVRAWDFGFASFFVGGDHPNPRQWADMIVHVSRPMAKVL